MAAGEDRQWRAPERSEAPGRLGFDSPTRHRCHDVDPPGALNSGKDCLVVAPLTPPIQVELGLGTWKSPTWRI